jgi:uncharacterized protein with HEPN domain
MTNETRQRLLDALEACRAIRRYTDGIDFTAYLRDDMLRDAVERRLGIIGEALHLAEAMDPALAREIPELRQIVGMRNRVIHGYGRVDNNIVWVAVQNRLPALQTRLADLLSEEASRDALNNPPPCA